MHNHWKPLKHCLCTTWQHIARRQWCPCHPVGNLSWEDGILSTEPTFQGFLSHSSWLLLFYRSFQLSGHQPWGLAFIPDCDMLCLASMNRFCAFTTALVPLRLALRLPLNTPNSSVQGLQALLPTLSPKPWCLQFLLPYYWVLSF